MLTNSGSTIGFSSEESSVTACLLHNESASYSMLLVKLLSEAIAKASLNWAYIVAWSRPETR